MASAAMRPALVVTSNGRKNSGEQQPPHSLFGSEHPIKREFKSPDGQRNGAGASLGQTMVGNSRMTAITFDGADDKENHNPNGSAGEYDGEHGHDDEYEEVLHEDDMELCV